METLFERALEKMIQDRADELATNLSTGVATDFADYRYRCGQINALLSVAEMMVEVRKKLNSDKGI